MTRTLVIFRNDLRATDNPAVDEAVSAGSDGCIGLFIATPTQWASQDWGNPKAAFIRDCVDALRTDLSNRGIPLLYRESDDFSGVPAVIAEVAASHACTAVHANRDSGVDEARRDRRISETLAGVGCSFHLHEGNSVLPVDAVRTGAGEPFKVFTPFRKKWQQLVAERGLPALDRTVGSGSHLPQADPIPAVFPGFSEWSGRAHWPGGTAEALSRLGRFLDGPVEVYHTQRDHPWADGTSCLSPWFASGAVSPVTALRPLVERLGTDFESWPQGPKSWMSELVWREFYRSVLEAFPRCSRRLPLLEWTERVAWRDDPEGFSAWSTGQTGIDIVDAAMQQLLQIGWMHNRMRMVVSMFLTKNLLIDWRLGEAFFARHLVDYDFASNNGGWQWAASTGTDAAPYFRIFNAQRQAETWDTKGRYVSTWLDRKPGSLNPIVDLKRSRQRAIAVFKTAKDPDSPASEEASLFAESLTP